MTTADLSPAQRVLGVLARVVATPLFRPSQTRRKRGLFRATLRGLGSEADGGY